MNKKMKTKWMNKKVAIKVNRMSGMKKIKANNNNKKVRKRKLKSRFKNNNNSKMMVGLLLRKRNEPIIKKYF